MAFHCAHCRSVDVQHAADQVNCLSCGENTDYQGRPLTKGESSNVVVAGRPVKKGDRLTTSKSLSV